MLPNDPRHGTSAGARAHWKQNESACQPCLKAANYARIKREQAGPRNVPLGELAHDIITNTPRAQLLAATGITRNNLIRYERGGPNKTVHIDTRNKILAAGGPRWTPIGIQRRLQALTALGWSTQIIAKHANMGVGALHRIRIRQDPAYIHGRVAEAVIRAYDELHMKLPPAGTARSCTITKAKDMHYLPPLAWDNIDDPSERPRRTRDKFVEANVDPAVVERVLSGDKKPRKLTNAEAAEIVRRALAKGMSTTAIERLYGLNTARYQQHLGGAA